MASNKSSTTKKTDHTAAVSKREPQQRINPQRLQNVLLIWLDNSIDENDDDCKNTITQLRQAVNDVNTYTNDDECIEFIQTIKDNKVCMIISGALGQHVLPRVHDTSQVDSIFIFCSNRKRHEQWVKDWPKIKGVFTEITPICEALKQAAQQCEHNATPMSFVASGKKLDQLDPSFMYTQILKEILSTIKFNEQHITEYVNYCREAFADNIAELKNVEKLERHYREKTPIWWYTCECFLYPMLNRALRVMDGDIMTRMGFFMNDLQRHIEKLHKEQYADHSSAPTFTVYRGQGLSKDDFDQLLQTKGGLMSFNSFLSTSTTRNVSLGFVQKAVCKPDVRGILFVMKIDPAQSTTPFASIGEISAIASEDEVLFAMHSVFRVHDIILMDKNNRLYEAHLSLTSDNDKELHAVTDRIREESFPHSEGWHRLALVLKDMGQMKKAEEICKTLLAQATSESAQAPTYSQLGLIKYNEGEYREAIIFHERSIEIELKQTPLDHSNLANSYNNIGMVYDSMGDYPKALSSYEKALSIRQQSLPPIHSDLAVSYNNIGSVYDSMGDYPKALSYYQKDLAISEQLLPPSHPNLASSYNNIGIVYKNMGDYPKALSSLEKALAIKKPSLPPNHPSLASSYNNIGIVYKGIGDYSKALASLEKALAIKMLSLPSNHPSLATSYYNIGLVYENMGNCSEACAFYKHAVETAQHSLPADHPDLKDYRESLAELEKKM